MLLNFSVKKISIPDRCLVFCLELASVSRDLSKATVLISAFELCIGWSAHKEVGNEVMLTFSSGETVGVIILV